MSLIFTQCLFTADEFLYQNQWGEIALLTVGNLSEKILMSNTTYVSVNSQETPLNHSIFLRRRPTELKCFFHRKKDTCLHHHLSSWIMIFPLVYETENICRVLKDFDSHFCIIKLIIFKKFLLLRLLLSHARRNFYASILLSKADAIE